MVEATGLAFQERQVVNRLEKRLLSIPAPRVPGQETVLVDEPDLIDGRHDDDLPMGIANGDRVVIGLKTHERLGGDRAVVDESGLERTRWQR